MTKKERKGIPSGKAWQFMKRDAKHATLRGLIAPVLDEECSSMCMDDPNEREYLLKAVIAALLGDP